MDRWDNATLRRLLSALRGRGFIPMAAPIEITPRQKALEAFSTHLAHGRGLMPSTVGSRGLHVRRFLEDFDPAGNGDFTPLCPEVIIGYVERHALDGAPDSGKAMCWSLRSFLRYLHLRGDIATPLADYVPSIRRWRLAGFPTFLSPEKVQQVLDSCDLTTHLGLRNYAILMILAKLGLRAGEMLVRAPPCEHLAA